ncbi:hypothetical protein ANCCEY_01283 [Ancylostoma ceylanicum]|uniref:Uncharacterized protein n=1 Tax=Ancylostoma ceylanicum TaxID=53326 RepID=A0A0D6MCV8_9BILA|nr:hypothetical protein ANCCEY_01283 [Ancylostoma ceylanicum]
MIHEEQRLVEEENRMNALKTRWKLRATLEALASEFSAIDFRKPFTVELRDRGSDLLESQAQSITVHAGYLLKENTSSYGGNQFVLRCRDGVIVDGSDVRLSRRVHRSCCYRDLAPAVKSLRRELVSVTQLFQILPPVVGSVLYRRRGLVVDKKRSWFARTIARDI